MLDAEEYQELVEAIEREVGQNGYYPTTQSIGESIGLSNRETAARLRVVDRAYRAVLQKNEQRYARALSGYDGGLDQAGIPPEPPETLIWSKSSTTKLNGVLFEVIDGLADDIIRELEPEEASQEAV